MSELEIWKTTEGGNDASPPDGAPEKMLRSGLNDVIREAMAKIKRFYDEASWVNCFYWYTVSRDDATTIRVAGFDATHILLADRRVKITDTGGPTTVYGYITSSSFLDPDTTAVIEVDGAAAIPVNANKLEVSLASLGRAAFKNYGSASSQLVDGASLSASIAANVSAKSAALKDYADSFGESDKVPLYDQLGTAAQLAYGTAAGNLPRVQDLPSILGALAYVTRGRVFGQVSANYQPGSSEVAITDLTGLTIPGANGVKQYTVECMIFMTVGADPDGLNLRIGTLGTVSDPVNVAIPFDAMTDFFDFDSSDPYGWSAVVPDRVGWLHRWIITPATGAKATVSVDVGTGDYVCKGSWMEIKEIIGS